MEKILSKKLTLMVALLLASLGLSTAAQTMTNARPYTKTQWVNGVPYQVTSLPGSESKMKQFIKANERQAPKPKKHVAKEEAQMVNVNIKIVERDNILNYPNTFFAFSEDGKESAYLSVGDNELEAGTYTFKANFTKLDSERNIINCYVFKESVNINENTSLTFDVDEAKNHVQMKIFDIEGNELQLIHRRLNADGTDIEYTEGEDIVMGGFRPLFKDDCGIMGGDVFSGAVWNYYNFYISDVDGVGFNHQLYFDKNDIIHTVSFYQKGIHGDITFVNDPNDFIPYEAEYKISPLGKEANCSHYPTIWNCFIGASFGTEIYRNVDDGKVQYCFGKSNFDPVFLIRQATGLWDYVRIQDWGDGEFDEFPIETKSLPILNIDGELSFMNCGYASADPANDIVYETDGELQTLGYQYPGHSIFSYPLSQKGESAIGNSCPIGRSFVDLFPNEETTFSLPTILYIGRYGERRSSDEQVTQFTLKLDDTEDTDFPSTHMWIDESPNNGTYQITFTNENVDVDELSGRNVTQLFVDKSTGDKIAPTLTMLHFRDNDNVVIDHFENSADGCVELSALDENYSLTDDFQRIFQIGTITVEVVYSPYGEDNWKEIAVEEDPSLFYLPDMGNFFRGSLEGVTGQAYEGWFDLKVKVTDAAGNWQEQVISPAFRIDDLAYSGIAEPRASDTAHEVARYNVAGQRVDANASGIVIIKMSDGTARKVIL